MLFEELGRALYHGPYFSTVALALPALPPTSGPRSPPGRQAGRSRSGRSSPTSTPPIGWRSLVGTGSTSSRKPSARCWRRATRRARSASYAEASQAGRLAESGVLEEIRSACSPRSRSRLAGSRRALEYAIELRVDARAVRRKIGVYQAVSHPLADAYTRLELARSLSLWAAWCVAEDDEQAPIAAAAAKASAAEAAVQVCETAIQVHGGIGFTWEHVLHRLYKRALWIESFGLEHDGFGPRSPHRCSIRALRVWLQPDGRTHQGG